MQLLRSTWQFFARICWFVDQPLLGTGVLVEDGRPLSPLRLMDWLTQTLCVAGFQGNFSRHSFGIGAARVAACTGVPDHRIQALGRWSSNAYQLYSHAFCSAGFSVPPLCAVHSVMSYLAHRGNAPGPLFLFQNGGPLSRSLLTDWLGKSWPQLTSQATSPATASASGRLAMEYPTTSSKPWAAGQAPLISFISELHPSC